VTDLHTRVFELRAEGLTQQAIVERLAEEGIVISRPTVSRVLSAGLPLELPPGEVGLEVERLAATVGGDLDAAGRATLALLRGVAAKVDQLAAMTTANSGVALASLAMRFGELVAELRPDRGGVLEDLRALLTAGDDDDRERYRAALSVIAAARSDGSDRYHEPRLAAEEAQQVARQALAPERTQEAR